MGIAENAAEINRRVFRALQKSGDPSRAVTLVAVSKTFPSDKILEAMDAGLSNFGENRVQEITAKYEVLRDRSSVRLPNGGQARVEWHFIGHLQTNKVKKLLEVPTKFIHSVDRLDLAVELDRHLQKRGESRDILIEVNTSGEASKSGMEPGKAMGVIRQISLLDTLKVKGLMTIGRLTEDASVIRDCFAKLRGIFLRTRDEGIGGVGMIELSMGMSGDFEIAVEEGATIIRVGTAIFGNRPAKE